MKVYYVKNILWYILAETKAFRRYYASGGIFANINKIKISRTPPERFNTSEKK